MRAASFSVFSCLQFGVSGETVTYPAACPDGICPGLGRAFYLPEPNAISGGGSGFAVDTTLFKCASMKTVKTATREMKVVNSMNELVKTSNTDWSLTGSYTTAMLTVKGNVDVNTGHSTDIKTSFHSVHEDLTYITQEITWDRSSGCWGAESDFDSGFLDSFKALEEISSDKVTASGTWAPYVNFLKYHGSHVMTEQSIGSRFQYWESSTSTSSDTSKTLQIKACAQVEGTSGPGGWSVGSCGNYSNSEKNEALKTESDNHRVILGGTTKTRIALLTRFSNETLDNFLDSAPEGDHPVDYGFTPVWQPLIDFYNQRCANSGATSDDCKYLQRAYNLQAAYEGWIAVGCSKQETSNGVVYQQMSITDPSANTKTYQCDAARTGCYSDDDCHLGGALSVCYCYGPSCIDSGEDVAGTSIQRDTVRGSESGHYYSGVNNACYYKFIAHCDCHKDWAGGLRARQLWVQDGSLNLFTNSSLPSLLV